MSFNLVDNLYSLSIRVRSNGFSFSVYGNSNELVLSENIEIQHVNNTIEYEQKISQTQIRNTSFKSFFLLVESEEFTVVPTKSLIAENKYDLLKLQHPSLSMTNKIYHTEYESDNFSVIFSFDEKIINIFLKYFPSLEVVHHLHFLLESNRLNTSERIYLQIRESKFDIVCYKNNKLLLANSYQYQIEEDILYYIFRIFQLFSLDYNKTSIQLVKRNDIKTDIVTVLKEYIANVSTSTII
ncbi:DUF3822 family protein [Paludibacter sp.]